MRAQRDLMKLRRRAVRRACRDQAVTILRKGFLLAVAWDPDVRTTVATTCGMVGTSAAEARAVEQLFKAAQRGDPEAAPDAVLKAARARYRAEQASQVGA